MWGKNKGITKGVFGVEGVFGQAEACLVGGSDWKDCSLRLFTATFGRSCSGDYPIVTNAVFFLFYCPLNPRNPASALISHVSHSSKRVSKRVQLSKLSKVARRRRRIAQLK